MSSEGWDLAFVTSAVESDAGKDDGKGIFITRYIFKKTERIIKIKKRLKSRFFIIHSLFFLDD